MLHVITGQTATGKTAHALKLAKEIGGELINADARQLYKKLNIVTGKDLLHTSGSLQKVKELNGFDIGYYVIKTSPTPTGHPLPEGGPIKNLPCQGSTPPEAGGGMLQQIPLWLYDIISPNQPFSTYEYKTCAQWVIHDITSRGKVPIMVGGSYFYIQHVLYDVIENEIPPNDSLRKELNNVSVEQLQNKLKELNIDLFNTLNNSEQHNPQRLIRRIEKEMYNRSPLAREPSRPTTGGRDVEIQIIGFQYKNKDDLQNAITERVEKRLQAGAIEETKQLLSDGYGAHDPGMKTIGYTQIMQHLNNELSYDQMKEVWINKEVQYAKRQLTFMKKNDEIQWISI
ncbi:MAG: tRNA (adenosine(37)-N6)-dimethylallyltransferase MiaA [bacterium]|nr:tRNA (adenosine(37)-N6)-dimethylallyltransferase MiaA [bacterium]